MRSPIVDTVDESRASQRVFRGVPTCVGAIIVAMLSLLRADVASAIPVTETRSLIADPEQKLSVEVSGWLGLGKLAAGLGDGLVPVEFTVTNGGDVEATIVVNCTSGYGTLATNPTTRIVAPAGATVRATIHIGVVRSNSLPATEYVCSTMLSFDPSPGSGPRRTVTCGVSESWQSISATTSVVPGVPPADVSPRVLSPAAGRRLLEAQKGSDTVATQAGVDFTAAPEDWRGWTSLRECVLTDDDWTAMPSGVRRAMLEWLSLGGHAILLASDTDRERLDRIGLPPAQADGRRRIGAGELIPLAHAAIPGPQPADEPMRDAFAGAIERPFGWKDSPWSGAALGSHGGFGDRGLPTSAILTFLAVLAITAGPVNIVLLAGRGRPSRIFWTTPLISLVATGLLLGLMVLRDGVGGAGVRRTLCLLDPDRKVMAVLQEQFSRTGVLLGSSFPIREPSWVEPHPPQTSPFVPAMSSRGGSFFEIDDERRSGDWFTSRSDQAFTLQTVRPGRGQIEVVGPSDAPEVLSSLDMPIKRLLLLDEEGRWWKTGPLGAGERRRLESADAGEFLQIQRGLASAASPPRARAVERLSGLRGYAWAEALEPGRVAISTLDAIRWTEDEAWFVGPFVRSEGR